MECAKLIEHLRKRLSIDGGFSQEQRTPIAFDRMHLAIRKITFVGDDLFWVTRHNDFETGAPADLVAGERSPSGLVLDGTTLLWTSEEGVRSVATIGGGAQTIVSNRGMISGIASDGEYLYWAESDRGAIVRMPLR